MPLPTLRGPQGRPERRRGATRSQQLGMLIAIGLLAVYVCWTVLR
jgi:hypothetical protein